MYTANGTALVQLMVAIQLSEIDSKQPLNMSRQLNNMIAYVYKPCSSSRGRGNTSSQPCKCIHTNRNDEK